MGLFAVNSNDLKNMVVSEFGESDNYVVALKHNYFKKSLLKLLISNLYFASDSSREFILYFDHAGIHEKEFSLSDNKAFVLIPWPEIKDFEVVNKGNKYILNVNHLDKIYSYEVSFNGRINQDNEKRINHLIEENWYRE